MANAQTLPYCDQTLPLVGEVTREIHLAMLQWVANVRGPVSVTAPLGRAMRRARVAVEMAAFSRSYVRHLQRAREDLLMCRAQLITLTDEGYFCEELFRDARRRLAQILHGIDQLIVTPIEHWDELTLVSLDSEPIEETPALQAKREALRQRISAIANLNRYWPDGATEDSTKRRGRSGQPPPRTHGPPRAKTG